ncbi:hypothetical protein GpartN1_g5029.t1 [Galdieria partita]|uniref:Thioredoxin domain-containing protein n=1 Tax=Galdieria partita TaxID=83374 RepID=A0A9C7URW7_9RHOD|nr:hypothetical protein GpartN1_g5029.t1 [Galdieria partita]
MKASVLFNGYYLSNLCLCLLYIYVRIHIKTQSLGDESNSIWNVLLEQQIYCIILLVGTVKVFQSPSWEATLSSFFFYCKCGFVILLFYFDKKFCIYFAFLCFVFAFLFLQPRYRGPSKVVQLSGDAFQDLVLSSKDTKKTWIVEFYVPWSEQVKSLDSLVAKVSLEYSNEDLCFGKLNLASYPNIATKLGIDAQSSTKAIPTFVVFERGKEKRRVPYLDNRGMAVPKEVWRMKKSELVSALQLDHYVFMSKMSG